MSEVGPGEATELKVALFVRAWLEIKPKEPVAEEERLHGSRPDAAGRTRVEVSPFSSRFRPFRDWGIYILKVVGSSKRNFRGSPLRR